MIQIMFESVSLMWNLETNQEVNHFIMPSQFDQPETFCDLGIKVNLQNPEGDYLIKTKYILSNPESSMFIRPATDRDPAVLFRLFTIQNLDEMQGIAAELESGISTYKFDPEVLLTNIYGKTFFTAFY